MIICSMKRQIVLIAHDIRSTHNVGSLLRTAECFGVEKVFLTGYSPYPSKEQDARLPHIHQKLSAQIHKTALGAEKLIAWEHHEMVGDVITRLQSEGYTIVALEQTTHSRDISRWTPSEKIAIVLGREVEGIAPDIVSLCDDVVEIPLFGEKESLNVVQAAAIAIYQARFA